MADGCISLAVLIFTLTFLAEIIFSFPLLVVRISLQELQLELMVEYALFFSVMAGIGWQFSRRTPPELKNRLHCWLVFSPVYFWLILSNFILYISPEKSALLENIRNFFLTFVWLPLNFSLLAAFRLILSARLVHSLVLHWDIIAIGAEKIETRGRSGAIG